MAEEKFRERNTYDVDFVKVRVVLLVGGIRIMVPNAATNLI